MRLALFSDVHANLPALEAVLPSIEAAGTDLVCCLGDLVGYAPWPDAVVDLVRERRIPTIAGNYDVGVGLHSEDCGCAYRTPEDEERGTQSIAFTNRVVRPDTRAWLAALPRHLRLEFGGGTLLLVHGSPRKVNQYLFEDHPDRSLLRLMQDAGADVLAFGHTHKPWHRALFDDESGRWRHAVNIGSVGKPKDGDPRACWVDLELRDGTSPWGEHDVAPRFVRVEYDVERTARAVEASELPDAFADQLRLAH